MKIVTAPNDVLSQKAKPIGKIDKNITTLIEEMKKTLALTKDPEGVGLAAPQVGKPLQIFITRTSEKSDFHVFINPKITIKENFVKKESLSEKTSDPSVDKQNKKDTKKLEGCLSLPQIWGEVGRAPRIQLSYTDEAGKKYRKTFKGFMAIILQHEYDHLQGILFPKHVLEQNGTLYKSSKNEKGEDVFDEIEL